MSSEHVCYVHCHFCNTILAVSVPSSTMMNTVTVRCGHCSNLLSVNVGGALLQSLPIQEFQKQSTTHEAANGNTYGNYGSSSSSSIPSKMNKFGVFHSAAHPQLRMSPISPPEKRQRVPSAYNRFIKEEIQRIKSSNPKISHREAFSTAAKNWAHFPHMHFGLNLEGNKQAK
ncbi:hypothetical protein Leryth_012115 [Lithospermum erythrorhizon]|uniref:Uncharacterized protein n=1 Tax=Lithospermum erythrorhizon TaxID=34254 RepID=A0AAV3PTZ6_LITER|nr:hypothetical protein Leryth_012115 [Lithospermum erythrorhizon]